MVVEPGSLSLLVSRACIAVTSYAAVDGFVELTKRPPILFLNSIAGIHLSGVQVIADPALFSYNSMKIETTAINVTNLSTKSMR